MKAAVYERPRNVAVEENPDPGIEHPCDAIVKVTTNICGSDLRMDEGRTSFERGRIFGHENMGQVSGEPVCPGVGRPDRARSYLSSVAHWWRRN